ncbi:MAG: DUF6603 domain-containing protein, partial [Bacteroidota bacterium]
FKITYPPTVEADIGLMVSITSPLVFALIGLIKAYREDKVDIKAAFSIVVDLGSELVAIDATLFDSKIGKIGIEGDMSARMGWGDNKQFLISVGGFHPNYSTDQFTLPELNRITLRIRDEERLRVIGKSYFAVTSNAVMFGSSVELLVLSKKFKKLRVEANAGLDALFLFNPFRFEVAVYAGAAVFWKGKEVMSATLDVFVKGPGRWHLKGYAEMKIAKMKVSAQFDKRFGDASDDSLPAISAISLLQEETNKPENWTSTQAVDESVEYIEQPEESPLVLAGPGSTLRLDQTAVPLNLKVQKVGENPVVSEVKIEVESVQIAAEYNGDQSFTDQTDIVREDYFAPANYKKLSDQDKLQAKSFELMQSGVDIESESGWMTSSHAVDHVQEYEVVEATAEGTGGFLGTALADADSKVQSPNGGQLGSDQNFRRGRRRMRMPMVKINPTEYVLVNEQNDVDLRTKSRTQARERMEETENLRFFKNSSSFTNVHTGVK